MGKVKLTAAVAAIVTPLVEGLFPASGDAEAVTQSDNSLSGPGKSLIDPPNSNWKLSELRVSTSLADALEALKKSLENLMAPSPSSWSEEALDFCRKKSADLSPGEAMKSLLEIRKCLMREVWLSPAALICQPGTVTPLEKASKLVALVENLYFKAYSEKSLACRAARSVALKSNEVSGVAETTKATETIIRVMQEDATAAASEYFASEERQWSLNTQRNRFS